jgi:prepilin-type N-terminal cleavage/methylation domain-containing protein
MEIIGRWVSMLGRNEPHHMRDGTVTRISCDGRPGVSGRRPRPQKGAPAARSRRSGFTLIETIAAVVILAVALPPMLWAVTQAHHQRANPMLASKARWVAVEKLEDIIADRHSQSGNRGWDWLDEANYPAENPGDIAGYPQFGRSISFTETQADLSTVDADGGYMSVTVTVTWTSAEGDPQALTISTVLTEDVFPP